MEIRWDSRGFLQRLYKDGFNGVLKEFYRELMGIVKEFTWML